VRRDFAAGLRQIAVLPGQFEIAHDADELLVALLGSCVSVCLRDRDSGIGGMNHIVLPDGAGVGGEASMAGLMRGLRRAGAAPAALEAKLFGGAAVMPLLPDIGAANLAFVSAYLAESGVAVIARDVGGTAARRLWYHPASGRSFLRRVAASESRVESAP
jgi:chemotaxis protein CheD